MIEMLPEDQLLSSDLEKLSGQHHPVRDSRGEIKACACGLHFGVQSMENGTWANHNRLLIIELVKEREKQLRDRLSMEIEREREVPTSTIELGYNQGLNEALRIVKGVS